MKNSKFNKNYSHPPPFDQSTTTNYLIEYIKVLLQSEISFKNVSAIKAFKILEDISPLKMVLTYFGCLQLNTYLFANTHYNHNIKFFNCHQKNALNSVDLDIIYYFSGVFFDKNFM